MEKLKQAGAAVLELDVCASQIELNRNIKETINIYGGVDVLVNNAGYIEAALLEDLTYVS